MTTPAAAGVRLRPYVAGLAAEWLRSTPSTRHRRVAGSLAFVDISGFTALTERLAARGKVGAEEMSDLLDATFVTLLQQAYRYGASLVKWGGDAVLLLFEGEEHALLAARAAFELRRTMREAGRLRTSVGVVQLKMSVGISSGAFDFFLVGDGHRELLVTGPAASTTAEMEQTAEAGQIVLSTATAALLPPRVVGAAAGNGRLLRAAPDVAQRSRYWPPAADVDLRRLLDPRLAEHLMVEVGDAEHRQVGVGFVEVSGVDALLARQGPGATAAALHELLTLVQAQCAQQAVTFWETDISRDGFKIMLVAGAPHSSGHNEDALLRASRAVLDEHSGPLRLRIGVNAGRVFNGGFGPPFRRTWSAKGDAINLAARVMGKAGDGQLLATQQLLSRVGAQVDAAPVPPFSVKGKAQLVTAAQVRAVTSARVRAAGAEPAFVGRGDEVSAVRALVASAAAGQGGALVVAGEPGSGKTRLVEHACTDAGPLDVVTVVADAYASAPYDVVRQLLRAVLGLAPHDAGAAAEAALRQRLPADDRLLRWLPLLGPALGIEAADTAETAAVEGEFRRDRTTALVVELLRRLVVQPTVFVLDDLQDADSASLEVLSRLADEASGRAWAVLLLAQAPPPAVAALPQLAMPPLSVADSRALVLALGGSGLPPHVLRAVVDRADGNPLFLAELTAAADPRAGDELPDSLEELLAGRIDRLDPKRRQLLRACAVLGTRFSEADLSKVLGEPVGAATWASVDAFLVADGDGRRRFRSGLVRDAAYEGLPFRRRVQLHGRAAAALEAARSTGADTAAALSLHCLVAERYADAWRYGVQAGRHAQQLYSNAEALVLYRRARAAARRLPDLSGRELATLLEAMGDAHARLAEPEPALAAYREARSRAPSADGLLRARVAMSAGLAAARAGQVTRALRWLGLAHREASREDGPDFVSLAALVDVERAYLRHMQGRAADASALCRSAIAQAEPVGADVVVARALLLLDMVDLWSGRPSDEARVSKALELFERADDLPRQAHTRIHLGMGAQFRGDWGLALERYAAALAAEERVGDDWTAAIVRANIGEILIDQGRLAEAEPLVAEALRVFRATSQIGFGPALAGRIAARQGRRDEALARFDEARAAYVAMDERVELIGVALAAAEALLQDGDPRAAAAELDEVQRALSQPSAGGRLAADGELPTTPHAVALLRLRGCAARQLGQRGRAAALLQQSVLLARDAGSLHELALALHAQAWAEGAATGPEGVELLGRLGIIALPRLPLTARTPRVVVVVPEPAPSGDVLPQPL